MRPFRRRPVIASLLVLALIGQTWAYAAMSQAMAAARENGVGVICATPHAAAETPRGPALPSTCLDCPACHLSLHGGAPLPEVGQITEDARGHAAAAATPSHAVPPGRVAAAVPPRGPPTIVRSLS